jgi:hypothetical protein
MSKPTCSACGKTIWTPTYQCDKCGKVLCDKCKGPWNICKDSANGTKNCSGTLKSKG